MINFVDIDECKLFNGGCEHDCTNNNGSFFCTCHDGYNLKDDHLSCVGMCQLTNTQLTGSYEMFPCRYQ